MGVLRMLLTFQRDLTWKGESDKLLIFGESTGGGYVKVVLIQCLSENSPTWFDEFMINPLDPIFEWELNESALTRQKFPLLCATQVLKRNLKEYQPYTCYAKTALYIVACQGGGVSSKARRHGADKTPSSNPLARYRRWTIS